MSDEEKEGVAESQPVASELHSQMEEQSESKHDDTETKEASNEDIPLTTILNTDGLKRQVFELINNERTNHFTEKPPGPQIQPLCFDASLSSIADAHCKEMAQNNFTSHWNLAGQKPFQRYAAGKVNYHVCEFLFGKEAHGIKLDGSTETQEALVAKVFEAHKQCRSRSGGVETNADQTTPDVETDGANADNLDSLYFNQIKDYTHVGVGIEITSTSFRYVEVYTSKLCKFTTPDPTLHAAGVHLSAKLTPPTNHSTSPSTTLTSFVPYAAVLYFDPKSMPLTVAQILELSEKEPLPDVPNELVTVVWPWQLEFGGKTASEEKQESRDLFSFELDVQNALDETGLDLKHGDYYLQLFVSKDPASVPFDSAVSDLDTPLAGEFDNIICAGSILLDYPSVQGLQNQPISKLCVIDSKKAVPEGYEALPCEADQNKLCFQRRQGPQDAAVVELVVAVGDHDIPPGFKVVQFFQEKVEENEGKMEEKHSDGERSGGENADLSSWVTPENDGESKASSGNIGAEQIFLCYRTSDDPVEVTARGINSVAVLQSAGEFAMDPTISTFDRMQVSEKLELCFQLNSAALQEDDEFGEDGAEEENDDGWGAGGGENEGGLKSGMGDKEMQLYDGEVSMTGGSNGKAQDAGGKRHELNMAERAAQSSRIAQMLQDAQEEHKRLLGDNLELQKLLVPIMGKKVQQQQQQRQQEHQQSHIHDEGGEKGDDNNGDGPGEGKEEGGKGYYDGGNDENGGEDVVVRSEQEKSYRHALKSVNDARGSLHQTQAQFDNTAMDLQTKLDEKESKATEIRDSFVQFKCEIAMAAENSRTGKPIPRRIINQFEETEAAKDSEVERVRLKNINLKTQLKKLESTLREKEQLAEGLHLIDFEQLKIENQTLNEKIEERNEELHKLRKKTTTTVQVLTHIKEKLQFVEAEMEVSKDKLSRIDDELSKERDVLNRLKHQRDDNRTQMEAKRQDQSFVNSKVLVKDYEDRKLLLTVLRTELEELHERYSNLLSG